MSSALTNVYCTFSCPRLLFVLGMVPHGVPVADAGHRVAEAAQILLAQALARDVSLVEGELFVELDDPIEAIVAARDHDLYLQRCIASGAAIELLREPDAPARETWGWLCKQLAMSPHQTYPHGLVKLGIGRHALPDDAGLLASEPGIALWIVPADGADRVVLLAQPTKLSSSYAHDPGDLTVEDGGIEHGHCQFTQREGLWIVEDRGSASGTFCEGSRVAQRRLLPGTMIRVAASLVVVLSIR